ncbi:MAG: T9SS type A sorting domain-containing protein [Bacteroidia bacterium]|nr:T9SS type A sorting domain-containing protein [Bacteroidia bacterium]
MKYYFILVFLFTGTVLVAQREGYIWIFGDSAGINFNTITPTPVFSSVHSGEASASVCNSNGNLLFYAGGYNYSNGIRIWSKNNQIMQNGDSIFGHSSYTNGLLIIPFQTDSNKYFLFHRVLDSGIYQCCYSIINLAFNNGNGKVIQKNIFFTTYDIAEKLLAIKHGNGRDWWLLLHGIGNNTFYKYLIVNDEIIGPYSQNIGSIHSSSTGGSFGEMEATSDGTKIIAVNLWGVIDLFDFDRCTGELSKWTELGYPPYVMLNEYYGAEFSFDCNILYVSRFDTLFQYDLNDPDINSSKLIIWTNPNPSNSYNGQLELAPDYKIYLATSSGLGLPNNIFDSINMNLSVINEPEEIGADCGFASYNLNLGGRRSYIGLPNIPNYNLGALEGSECDTLTDVANKIIDVPLFKIYPNPAKEFIYIETKGYYEEAGFELYDIYNTLVLKQNLQNKKIQRISLQNIRVGVYFYRITSERNIIENGKLVKL